MSKENGKEALIALGFTGLEADIYVFLLTETPSTGYRIAQAIGKPAANVYKAIELLALKGFIQIEDGDNRYCSAVPLKEILGRLENDNKKMIQEAKSALEDLEQAHEDERIYHLETRGQIIERAKSMLERAEEVVMLDLFPLMLDELKDDIERAARRGIEVNLITYEAVDIDGVFIARDPRGKGVNERWPVQVVNIVIDAKEQLLAYLTQDGADVHEAIWSTNIYLSWLQHVSTISEITLIGIDNTLNENGSIAEIRKHYEKYRSPASLEAPGYRIIRRRFVKSAGKTE